jgi:hypothetical protein
MIDESNSVNYGLPDHSDDGPLYVGGIWWGKNVPADLKIDTETWHDVILVSREYFLKNLGLIAAWAKKREKISNASD